MYQNIKNMYSNKKNLLVYIDSSDGELDSFLPVIHYLKKKNTIDVTFFFDQGYRPNKKNNLLLSTAYELSDNFIIMKNSPFNNLLRLISFIDRNINFDLKIINKFLKRLYVIYKIKKNFFFDLIISNIYQDIFFNSYKKLIILPHSQHIYSNSNNIQCYSKAISLSQKELIFFFSNRDEKITKQIYKKVKILNPEIHCCGYPKYNKNWLSFLNIKFNNNQKFDVVIFVGGNLYFNLLGPKKFYRDLKILIDFINHFNLKAVFKLHPRHQIFDQKNEFVDLINSNKIIISDAHPFELSKNSNFVIAQWTSTIMDALYMKKPVINFSSNIKKFNSYNSFNLVYKVYSKKQLFFTFLLLKKNYFKNDYQSNFFKYLKNHKDYYKQFINYLDKIFIT